MPALATVLLRRTGARPLRVTGRLIADAEAGAGTGGGGASIRLALFRCDAGGYAVAMSCEPAVEGAPPWHLALICPTLEQAIVAFETAEPTCDDVAPPPAALDSDATLLYAAQRVCRAVGQRHDFRNAVGAFLYDLCKQRGEVQTA